MCVYLSDREVGLRSGLPFTKKVLIFQIVTSPHKNHLQDQKQSPTELGWSNHLILSSAPFKLPNSAPMLLRPKKNYRLRSDPSKNPPVNDPTLRSDPRLHFQKETSRRLGSFFLRGRANCGSWKNHKKGGSKKEQMIPYCALIPYCAFKKRLNVVWDHFSFVEGLYGIMEGLYGIVWRAVWDHFGE